MGLIIVLTVAAVIAHQMMMVLKAVQERVRLLYGFQLVILAAHIIGPIMLKAAPEVTVDNLI